MNRTYLFMCKEWKTIDFFVHSFPPYLKLLFEKLNINIFFLLLYFLVCISQRDSLQPFCDFFKDFFFFSFHFLSSGQDLLSKALTLSIFIYSSPSLLLARSSAFACEKLSFTREKVSKVSISIIPSCLPTFSFFSFRFVDKTMLFIHRNEYYKEWKEGIQMNIISDGKESSFFMH